MTWERGYVEMACGHRVGTAHWNVLWIGADEYCPQCDEAQPVTRMSRTYEARGSRNFQLGVVGGDADGPTEPGEPEAAGP